jgi:hypothetical protein
MATRAQQDITHHITVPDQVTLTGRHLKVLSSGIVTDRFFRRITPTRFHPETVKLDCIRGMDAARVQFIVSGSGNFTVTYDSVKGGLLESPATLPAK